MYEYFVKDMESYCDGRLYFKNQPYCVHYFDDILSVPVYLCRGVVLFKKHKERQHTLCPFHRYGVVIAARNESMVIGNLIRSIQNQTYPSKLIDIFVVADNCTDNTAQIARQLGAVVYERFNKEQVGKGYALDFCVPPHCARLWRKLP